MRQLLELKPCCADCINSTDFLNCFHFLVFNWRVCLLTIFLQASHALLAFRGHDISFHSQYTNYSQLLTGSKDSLQEIILEFIDLLVSIAAFDAVLRNFRNFDKGIGPDEPRRHVGIGQIPYSDNRVVGS